LPDFEQFEITFSNFAEFGVVELSLNGVIVGVAEARIPGRLQTTVRMSYADGSVLRLTARSWGNLSSKILLLLTSCICSAGYTGNTNCVPCDAGIFKSGPGAGACLPCDTRTYNTAPGSDACYTSPDCPPGQYSTTSSATCVSCPDSYSATALTNAAYLTQFSLDCIQFVKM